MKRFLFIAGVVHNGRPLEQRIEVDADSEPEAIYDAKKGVSGFLARVQSTVDQLKRFDLVSVRVI